MLFMSSTQRNIVERARQIAERHKEATDALYVSPYLQRPLRTIEQTEADIARGRKAYQSLVYGCPSTFVEAA